MQPAATDPRSDADFLRDLVARTQRRVDPHAFHFVWWGAIVLVWYPLATWLQQTGQGTVGLIVGISALVLGGIGSGVLEARLKGRSRIEAEDSPAGDRVGQVVAGNVGAGLVLSVLAPSTGFVDGPMVAVLWGLVYASLAFHVGLVYSVDFLWSAAFIFAGSCVAMAVGPTSGYFLGPVMGLGLIVPGLRAERRVRRMRAEDAVDAVAAS